MDDGAADAERDEEGDHEGNVWREGDGQERRGLYERAVEKLKLWVVVVLGHFPRQ